MELLEKCNTPKGAAQRDAFKKRWGCYPSDLEPSILTKFTDHIKTLWWSIFTHPEER